MDKITEQQKAILKVFFEVQCDEEDGSIRDYGDGTPLVSYNRLEEELKISRSRIKPDMLDLRNTGYIELSMAVNRDYVPSGSGWILTEKKGEAIVQELFINKKEPILYE